ncbi:hypothetical protein [Bacillus paramycoides]|uniref:Uncharacterized protein n=1 Tax=Bacillus paramycoides TaxID=2026194 RepID=A0A1J9VLR6_9BACI|nr:hypothetical protein [Bacillus paramycoides]OJD82603.1 hypothetical protein BAU28_19685 [Bacillus paramycoides]
MQQFVKDQPQYVSAEFYSWGFGLKLNERETSKLVKVLGTASVAAWVAAELAAAGYIILPASVPTGLIAAIIGFSAAYVVMIDNGRGITIGRTWWGTRRIYAN